MQCVILAAGRGKRLGAITKKTQKGLVRVAGVSTIERLLNELPDVIHEIILVVGYQGKKVRAYFGDAWEGKRIQYAEQPELLGSADALHYAQKFLRGIFLVLNGDDFYKKEDLERLVKEKHAILVFDFGKMVKTGKPVIGRNGNLKSIIINSESRIVNTGAYMLDERFFSYPFVKKSPQDKEFGLPHTIAAMAKDISVRAVIATFWMPGGTPKALAKASVFFEKNKGKKRYPLAR